MRGDGDDDDEKIFMGGDTRSHEIFCDIFAIFADLCDLSHLEVTSDTSP